MSIEQNVTCDGCGARITSTGNAVGYRLGLYVERLATEPGVVTMLHVEPPLPHDHHFCGLRCLGEWLDCVTARPARGED